jgi:putative ABC transport system permease protein
MRPSRIAFRNLFRNTRRTVLSIGAITIASILGVFFLAMIDGMEASAREITLKYYTGTIQVRHEEYGEYEYLSPMHLYIRQVEPLRQAIAGIPGVTLVTPRVNAPGQIYIDPDPTDLEPGERHRASAFSVDLGTERDLLEPETLVEQGRIPRSGEREVALGWELAETTGLRVGDSFAFITQTAERSTNAMSFQVTGILDFPQADLNSAHFLVSFQTMQPFLRMEGGAQQLIVMTKDPEAAEEQLTAVEKIIAEDPAYDSVAVSYWKEESFLYSIMAATGAIYDIMVIFFLVLGATVIINTTMMTVFERYREIGVLGAMGMKPAEIVRLFFLEAVFAGLISAIIGVAVGSGISLLFGEVGLVLPATYGELGFEMSNVIYPKLTLSTVVLMFVYTVTIPALVTLLPSSKAARIEPVDAINAP